jgi:DNA replication protein DnaC
MLRLKMFRAEGSILKYFDKIAKVSLLILDDFGYSDIFIIPDYMITILKYNLLDM